MNKFEKDIANLIKCAIEDTTPICIDLDYKEVLVFAKRQQIVSLLFYSLSKLESFKSSTAYQYFMQAFFSNLQISENQTYELNAIFEKFKNSGIDFVPLKGCVLKQIYPKADMRFMSDADILIKLDQLESINNILSSNGYIFVKETDHEIIWNKNKIICIELHKKLIPSYNDDYYSYYQDPWAFFNENKFIKDEDFLIYLITHFAKHYRDGAIILKSLIDIYVFTKSKKDLDYEYIKRELQKLHLFEFYTNITGLLRFWFDGGESNSVIDFLTDKIFNNNYNKTIENWYLFDGLKKSKKQGNPIIVKIFRAIFPTYSLMTYEFAFLKKAPYLLPFVYVYRLLKIIFTKPTYLFKKMKKLQLYSNKNVSDYQKELNFVGLDFNYEDKNEKRIK